MKFKEFRKPILESKLGNYSFRLYDGSQTKEFSAIGDFNDNLGCYEICDGNGSIVEYMDLIGNFSKKPTTFAMHFNNYFKTRFFGVRYGVSPYGIYYTSVIDFPSRYFTNKKVREIIKAEENYRFKIACKNGSFAGLVEKLRYKVYIDKIFKQKLKRARYNNKKLAVCKDKDVDLGEYVLTL